MTWLGVSIALLGALGYALGAALQQYEAVADGATLKLVRRPRWWIGGAIGFAGAALHAVALSFAPLIVVQPVSVTTLVFAVRSPPGCTDAARTAWRSSDRSR